MRSGGGTGALKRRLGPDRLVAAGTIGTAVTLVLFGLAYMVNQVVGNTLIQTSTPAALLGRVFGAFEATVVGAVVLGALAAGPLIGTVGPRMATVALAFPGLALLLGALPRLGTLEQREQVTAAIPASDQAA